MARRLERVNRFLDGISRTKRDIISPEGIVLEVDIARHGERIVAFSLDFLFWMLATVFLVVILLALLAGGVRTPIASTIILFLSFLLRNLYFIYFELTMQGLTPGKRIVGLRVIDRNGGPLLPMAIVARNLTREIEVFLPLGLYFSLPALGTGSPFWLSLSYFGWIVLVSALPFFNKDHLRAGDLIAGTMVISVPQRVLLDDLVVSSKLYTFSRNQLAAYGAFELQVLEELLRRPWSEETNNIQHDVCQRIRQKINWQDEVQSVDTLRFLQAFYSAQRAHLERDQLFGKFRADKFSPQTTEIDG